MSGSLNMTGTGFSTPWRSQRRVLRALLCALLSLGLSALAEPLHFVQITDTHLGQVEHLRRTRLAIDMINALPMPIACVVHTGDIAADNLDTAGIAELASNELARIRVPLLILPGNHDIHAKRTATTLAVYRRTFGPLATRHDFGGVRFLTLYTEPLRSGIEIDAYDPLAWLAAELDAAGTMPVLLFHHAPSPEDFYGNTMHAGWPEDSRRRWDATLARGNVQAIIAGHFHRHEQHWVGDIPLYVSGPIAGYWDREGSFRLYTWDAGRLSYRTIYIPAP